VAHSHAPAVSHAVSGTLTGEDAEGKQSLKPRRPVVHRPPRPVGATRTDLTRWAIATLAARKLASHSGAV
jgi:hypothetical protein